MADTQKNTFLILGSEGQIGNYLKTYLKNKGEDVLEWDIKLSPDQDLTKKNEELEKLIEESDFVYFLAYDVGGSKYLKQYQDTFDFINNNTLMMSYTFDLLKKHKKKFIFASSQMVRLNNSNYGRLKAIGEEYTKSLGGIFSRFWNVYGIEHEEEKAHVITDFIKRAHHDRNIKMLTDGTEVRQFLYADDCSEALYTIYKRYDDFIKEEKYSIDISNFEWSSIREIAQIIAEEFPGTKITPGTATDEIQRTNLDRFEPSGEILKYWKPKTNIKEGILNIIQAMKDEGLLEKPPTSPKPLVSTITPCFKMKKYLPEFLKDLPNQTYFENLQIVLDHNEPDQEEIQWVKDFNKKYPNKIKHIIVDKVDPIGVSMNRCIKEADGEIVTIWNVDDLRTPDSIETQVKMLLKEKSDIVGGDYKVVRSFPKHEGGMTITHSHYSEEEHKKSMLLGPFVMFKKDICQKAGYFDEQLKSGADYDLCIRLAYNGKISMTKDILGYYLNEGKGASTRPDSKQPLERTVIELRYGLFDKLDMSYIPLTINYSIPHIISFGQAFPVSNYVKNYDDIITKNITKIKKSVFRTTLQDMTGYKKIKSFIKAKIKKIFYENNRTTTS